MNQQKLYGREGTDGLIAGMDYNLHAFPFRVQILDIRCIVSFFCIAVCDGLPRSLLPSWGFLALSLFFSFPPIWTVFLN